MNASIDLLQELTWIPAPSGQETELVELVSGKVAALGLKSTIDPKGNLLVYVGPQETLPKIVVTAHMDELGLIVTDVLPDGTLQVTNLGGVRPWKWGEGPVELLGNEPWPGILCFGSVHTSSSLSTTHHAESKALEWTDTLIFTGRTTEALEENGIGVGTRVAIARSRRALCPVGEYISGFFLDDRADLAAWFLVLEEMAKNPPAQPILFAATASEEVGGEGALYLLHKIQPDICVALELGPVVPDTPVELCEVPTVWVKDSYAAIAPKDLKIVQNLGIEVQYQALSSGGSDASCAASHGLCARPVTFGIPMENTHGFEIIHRDGIDRLVDLTQAYLGAIDSSTA